MLETNVGVTNIFSLSSHLFFKNITEFRFERFGEETTNENKKRKTFFPSHSQKSNVNGLSGIEVALNIIQHDFVHVCRKAQNSVR